MKLLLNDKRKFNYVVLVLLGIIILIGVTQLLVDFNVLPL